MKHVKKSVLLWYSPHEMYTLVTAIDDYPKFLPWCNKAEVLQRHADGVTARLGLSYLGLRQSFTTRNEQVLDRSVLVHLVDGPFSLLDGTWLFHPVGGEQQACRVDFELRWEFANIALETLISPVFDRIANTFVDSFVKRAEPCMVAADGRAPHVLQIEVVYCPGPRQADRVALALPAGCTVFDALQASGLLQRHRLTADTLVTGVWGRQRPLNAPLRDQDRVEIYRPLTVDPKQARRLRQQRDKGK